MTKKYHSVKYNDWDKINLIGKQLVERREELLESLGIEFSTGGRMLFGACPVHGGDRHNAFNWYESGKWACYTHNCHLEFKDSPIGLLRGLLSHTYYDWTQKLDRKYSWDKTIEFALRFLESDYGTLQIDADTIEKNAFKRQMSIIGSNEETEAPKITREMVRKSLRIPSQFYLERGYKAETLDKYDVGNCIAMKKPMSWRAVVPIYDEKDNFIGCTGRSVFPQCNICKLYHSQDYACPSKQYEMRYTKWRHSKGFNREHCLYNINFAKKHIQKSGVAILVESPGNVWKLEEAGIHNSVGCFGASLTFGQKSLLDSMGALSIITIGDNDEGGAALCKDVVEKCSRSYRLYFPKLNISSDLGDMRIDEITNDVKPFIDTILGII